VLAALADRGRDVDDAEVAYHLARVGPATAGPAAEYARRAGDRISEAHPELGRHLARSVRTGTFCVYEPDQPVRWSL
jgi:hypothetical protein